MKHNKPLEPVHLYCQTSATCGEWLTASCGQRGRSFCCL